MQQHSHAVPTGLRQLHEPALDDPISLFESTHRRILHGADVALAVDVLTDGLWWMRRELAPAEWREMVRMVRAHPVMGLLHENPLARRAFVKPRGYAGDAPMIDMVYHGLTRPEAEAVSPLGLDLLRRDMATPLGIAVRERRDFMAELIDHVAAERPWPAVLAAACGHLREGMLSTSVRQRRLGRLVALDQDPVSLAVVRQDYGELGIELVERSVRAAFDTTFEPGSFDLIYAAGLYDYLDERFAKALTRAFFGLLKPGGRLVVGNLAAGGYDAGYCEAVGDWFMVYRDAWQMHDLAALVDAAELALRRVYTRHSPDIFYLELRRRGARGG